MVAPIEGGELAATRLRLRPLRPDDETAFIEAHRVLEAEGVTFGLGFTAGTSWSAYLTALAEQRAGTRVAPGRVPMTFLVAEVDGVLVGRASIRHTLNEELARLGGHIGYCVLPEYRRRGYATEILRQSLIVARALGIGRVLVACDEDNLASQAVIMCCGGRLDSVATERPGGVRVRRYWID
jgi:predicted acetyltransferase